MTSVGAPTLPPPVRLRLADLPDGACDERRIEIAGTIAAADIWSGQLRIELTEGAHRIEIRVQEYPLLKAQALVGARILARGVCTPSPKDEAKVADLRLLVPRFSELTLDAATLAAIERPGDLPVLTEAGAIRALSAEEAGRHYPVRLRAIVTYADPAWSMLFVQDGSGGVYVDSHQVADLRAGDLIELEGSTDAGNFAPQIVRPTIRVVGRAPLPRGKRADVERLLTGMEDSQWVETTGVVRAVSRNDDNQVLLHLAAGRSRFSVVYLRSKGRHPRISSTRWCA